MNSVDIIFIVLGAFSVLTGLASIVTGKVYDMGSSVSRYTEESLARYARPSGFARMLIGAALMVSHLLNAHLFFIGTYSVTVGFAAMVALFVVALVIYLASSKLLVKKAAC